MRHMICSDTGAPNRRERKVIETRSAILSSARSLIEEQGFDATTVDQIAEHADVATRTFFRYFPNKESILFAEFDEQRESMIAELEARPEDEDLFESLAIALSRFAAVIDDKWADFAWAHEVAEAQVSEGSYERSIMRQQVHSRITDFIAARLGVSISDDPRPASWAMAIISVFGHSMAVGPANSPTGRSFDTFIQTLRSTELALVSMADAASAMEDVAAHR